MNSRHTTSHPSHTLHHNPKNKDHEDFPSDRPNPKVDRLAYEKWYDGLTDEQKHAEWHRYHTTAQNKNTHPEGLHAKQVSHKQDTQRSKKLSNKLSTVADVKKHIVSKLDHKTKSFREKHGKPLLIAGIVGFAFMTLNYNHIVIGQVKSYVSPGKEFSTPVILDPNAEVPVGSEPKIVIPKINVDVPVVYDVKTYDETQIQQALERGVVHYGETSLPGQIGNNVIVGHSSNNFFNAGKYKFAFVLIDRLEVGDTFVLHFEGKRYIYKVYNKQVVAPNDFSLIQPTTKPVTTLITCTPPGTSWKRLIVQAEQIAPDPSTASLNPTQIPEEVNNTSVPGGAPSIWDRIF